MAAVKEVEGSSSAVGGRGLEEGDKELHWVAEEAVKGQVEGSGSTPRKTECCNLRGGPKQGVSPSR